MVQKILAFLVHLILTFTVPFDLLGPKGNADEKGNRPHLPNGFTPGDGFDKTPTGTNNISFASFDYGDIILVHDGTVAWGYYRHTGIWDNDFYAGSIYDNCIWEATPPSVTRGTPDKFRHYDEAVGLWVPAATAQQRYDTTVYAYLQNGEPYDATAAMAEESTWYCSKLVYLAYVKKANIDLSNGWFPVVVYPDDIYQDSDTYIFASAT